MLIQYPKVVIGITTRNRMLKLKTCIKSILTLNYPNLVIRILCDGCTDGTEEMLSHYPQIEVLVNIQSIGLKKSRNKLMSFKDYEYFINLDDDIYFLENDAISKLVLFMEQNLLVGVCSFDIFSNAILGEIALKNYNLIKPFQISEFIGCGNIIRKKVIDDCGLFNESNLPYGFEEQEFSINCLKKSWAIYQLPGCVIVHDEEVNNRSYDSQWIGRTNNVLYIIYHYYPFRIRFLFLIMKMCSHLFYGIKNRMFLSTCRAFYYFVFIQLKDIPVDYSGRLSIQELFYFLSLKRLENRKKI
jgi:GT2 family glycosyltransferase